MHSNAVRLVFDNHVSDYIAADRLYYRAYDLGQGR